MADQNEEVVDPAAEGEEVQKVVEEEVKGFNMAEDECYPDDHIEKPF
jgi:hypothetical protein